MAKARAQNLKPPPKLNLVEWADEYRYLSREASSQPGRWRTSQVEVARGPMLAVTEPGVREITIMACTQLLKTELILNLIGYFCDQDPAPMLAIQPTVNLAQSFSKDRVTPMFRDTPVLQGKLSDVRAREGGNTILSKQFPGGHITFVGANSPTDLASRPVRVVLCDEVDKYPWDAGGEGDPIRLAFERSATFFNRLLIKACSPTVEGRSRIDAEYESSDKRVYQVPCQHCGHRAEMQWENVTWPEGQPELAGYACGECGVIWTEAERRRSISQGTWVATAPFKGHAGFRVNKLASPWEPLSVLAEKWERIKATGNPEQLKTFFNTQLAQTFKEAQEAPPWQDLADRKKSYPLNRPPRGVLFLTAGVDVQKDRVEVEIVGWGRGGRSWSIDYRVIHGYTSRPEVWTKLGALLSETWTTEDGALLNIQLMAVDSGYNTSKVYAFARKHGSRVASIKGKDNQPTIIIPPKTIDVARSGKRLPYSVKLYTVGVGVVKDEVYGALRLTPNDDGSTPDGYCDFPDYTEEHFKALTAETKALVLVRGYPREIWQKPPGARNEQLDCRVYARAAAAIVGMDRMKPADWDALSRAVEPQQRPKPKPAPATRRRPSIWGDR